jgi:hypothetical protein
MSAMATHEKQIPLDGSLSGAQGTQLADASTNSDHDSTLDRIRMRAYEFYLERGTDPDNALEDWVRAEREYQRSPDEPLGTYQSRAS